MVSDLITGASYLLKGYRLITAPGLRRFVMLPFLINLSIFALLIWLGIDQFGILVDWLLSSGEDGWIAAARAILWLLFTIAAILIFFFTFTLAANLIGAPFNGLLSEKVEAYLSGGTVRAEGEVPGSCVKRIIVPLVNELRKFFSFLLLTGFVLLLAVIPVVNVAFPVAWALSASWLLSLEYLGYPMENHGIRLGLMRNHLAGKRLVMLGFGLAVLFASVVPPVNVLIMPAAVAGATALWIDNRPGP